VEHVAAEVEHLERAAGGEADGDRAHQCVLETLRTVKHGSAQTAAESILRPRTHQPTSLLRPAPLPNSGKVT
jgi:hypothetical protein